MPTHLCALMVGALMDLLLGDPEWFPHPVRLIGRYIAFAESRARRGSPGARTLRRRAVGVALSTVLLTAGATWGALGLLGLWGRWPRFIGMCAISWTCLSARSLSAEANAVRRALDESLEAGRARLSRIVGRDTAGLSRREVVCAAVETVAENLSDGVISPMLWLAVGGPVLGMAFKAVSTLDSMIGYLNEKYRDIGWCGARLDDAFNFIPARLTALLMCAAAPLVGLDGHGALRIVRRDHANHLSPNCGWPEAAAAGALGIRLGGAHRYFGELVEKPAIGDDARAPEPADIHCACALMYVAAALMLALIAAVGAWA